MKVVSPNGSGTCDRSPFSDRPTGRQPDSPTVGALLLDKTARLHKQDNKALNMHSSLCCPTHTGEVEEWNELEKPRAANGEC